MLSKMNQLLERKARLNRELEHVNDQIAALRQGRNPDHVLVSDPVPGAVIRTGSRRFLVVEVGPPGEDGRPEWIKGNAILVGNRVSAKISTLRKRWYFVEAGPKKQEVQ